ncbi:hypothetical protein P154DRAFT_560736 [Amniculicola lignicola CBS 123094]|uniref:Uncharacterized protein n=1 Tax=Amniculicola lignicola CBS 123094 TaxID=1392246 RepID=A0A6A5WRD1_9PLEO|nr:hypothetical protein P154DRAFT_560736 [Amniculicola lignicola CBS 123094]
MVDASVIVSIVIAVISFLGTLVVAFISHVTAQKLEANRHDMDQRLEEMREERQDARDLAALTAKYSQPLMVAAYELEHRLYELLEYPISKEHLEMEEGLEDIKIFTCYKFAVFLAWTHILKSKTQYFSFATDRNLRKIGDLILRVNEEFDRRRGNDGQNVGVWPGSRILVSERMIKNASYEKEVPLDTIVKGYDEFRSEWKALFRDPMAYFCQWIDDMLLARKEQRQHKDDALRCTQHNLVDMVQYLDDNKLYPHMRRVEGPWFCDCTECNPQDREKPLEYRGDTRLNDRGLRPWYIIDKVDRAYDASVPMKAVRAMTSTTGFNQALTGPKS